MLKLSIAIGLLCLIITQAGCSQDNDRWDDIVESGILRVGLDPTYPPFELAEGEHLTGFDVDLARGLAAELDLEPRFTYFGYDGLYDALTTGQVDLLISALVIAPERTREVAYTPGYFDAGQYLVVPAHAAEILGMNDLADKTLAVELGALGHVTALDWQRRQPRLIIIPYHSADEALGAVVTGEAQAALVDRVSAGLFLTAAAEPGNSPLRMLPEPVAPEPYAIAVRIEDRTLLNELAAALADLKSNGYLESLVDRWIGQ